MKTIVFVLIVAMMASCTKVIDLKLRDSEARYVVEGVITNEPGMSRVYLSTTRNFNDDNSFSMVSGAVVKVQDNGLETTLTETGPGEYAAEGMIGTPGHLYTLFISVEGQVFTASCLMPPPVAIDSLYISKGPFGEFKFATVVYTDPAATDNGYRFVQYVNGAKEPTIFWDDDEFTDGLKTITQLDASADEKDDPRNIKTGDNVTVEMQSLDEEVLQYWYSLRAEGGTGQAATAAPANPVTNVKGGALGYFSAHSVTRKSVVAP